MKKFLTLFIVIFFSTLNAFSADMRFIQVDGALYNPNNPENFSNLIEKINNEKNIEFIVFTGNNICKPDKNILKSFLKEAKKINKPYYLVLGQKDVNKQKGLSKQEYIELVKKKNRAHKKITSPNSVFTKKNLVFIIADGSKEFIPTAIGYYREDVLVWLDDQLDKYNNKHVIILQHYPIVPPIKKETHYTYKADEYMKLLSEHSNVKAVIAGHFNTNKEDIVEGILHISTKNAPNYRVIDILDYETENPTLWSTIKE